MEAAKSIERGDSINGDYSPENIIDWRVRSYINPATGQWTATGLRANSRTGWSDRVSWSRVNYDQTRRYNACERAIKQFRAWGKIPEGY